MVRYMINTTELNTTNQKTKTSCRGHSEEHGLDIIRRQEKKGDPRGIRSLASSFQLRWHVETAPAVIIPPPGVARIDNMEMLARLAETMPHVGDGQRQVAHPRRKRERGRSSLRHGPSSSSPASSPTRDRIAAELGGGEGGALSPRRAPPTTAPGTSATTTTTTAANYHAMCGRASAREETAATVRATAGRKEHDRKGWENGKRGSESGKQRGAHHRRTSPKIMRIGAMPGERLQPYNMRRKDEANEKMGGSGTVRSRGLGARAVSPVDQ